MDNLLSKYANILEQFSSVCGIDELNSYPLFSTLQEFIKNNDIKNVLISLSGGVDSMVLLELIKCIKGITIYCCHINYNNREESNDERDFLKEYCELKKITFDYKDIQFRRHDTKRDVYEKVTRDMRYEYYKEMCLKYNCHGVFLAHHKDDVCENIFNNIMRGSRELTDLTVISEKNHILGVNVYRPMLMYFKDAILEIAHTCNIPYFLDTTPEWSCRGKMRRNIFPQCDDCYSSNYKSSLLKLGKESEEIESIIQKYLIESIMTNIEYDTNTHTIIIPNETILQEVYILKIVMRQISHKYSTNNMKIKSIEQLSKYLKEKAVGKLKITLLKGYTITINIDTIRIDREKIADNNININNIK